ncbi:MAG: site-specific DNA-methyltransferase [Oscillospiraceae bacterium]|nr:site-specific DNA-methyltransferase [Oscillospiraceae bacterium]
MDKLKMHSINKVDENIEKIGKLFPNCITERKNEKGEVEYAIDFDMLKQELSAVVVEGNEERYQFTWPDKKKSILLANAPIAKTLRPCREESVDFDNTENLYIEGDNLDVLKLLQETYLGKIKMIYIDPPYNTGNDFVYNDDFAESANEYLANSGQFDEDGNRLVKNLDSNGRYHTDWLNMLYTRLKISKDLLSDDGIVYISIDDNEVINLRKICDEIFGECNFIAQIVWKNKFGSGALTSGFIGVHEYILVYSKKPIINITRTLTDEERENYNKTRDSKFETRGGYVTQPLAVTTFGDRPNLRYPITYKGQEIWPNKQWVWEKSRMLKAIENDDVVFNLQKDGSYNLRSKKYLIDENGNERRGKPTTIYTDVYTQNGTEDIRVLFDKVVFDYTKPVKMLQYLIDLEVNNQSSKEDLILDFFSGSATTAHAVMRLNAEDGGNRKFIMVQLPEETDEKSEAYKAGYKNICEIGKERIRRAGAKIKEESPMTTADLDTGFRVLKLDSTNMKDVYYNPADYEMSMFDTLADNIKEDRTPEDLLFQVMLDLGVVLSSKIEESTIGGKKVFNVADGFLMACFDENVSEETITAIAKQKPYYFVMRDSSMASDSVATNFDQIFATYSPDTVRKVL